MDLKKSVFAFLQDACNISQQEMQSVNSEPRPPHGILVADGFQSKVKREAWIHKITLQAQKSLNKGISIKISD